MKTKIVLGILLIIGLGIGFYYGSKGKVELTDIEYFEYYYSPGLTLNGDERLILEKKEDTYYITMKEKEEFPENAIEQETDKKFADNLLQILKKYNVGKWDGYHKKDSSIMDGNSFTLTVDMKNNHHISASGYMKYPNHYKEVIQEIEALFTKEKNSTNS